MSESDSGDNSGNVPLPTSEPQGSDNPSPLPLDYAPPPKSRKMTNAQRAAGGALLSIIFVGWVGSPRLGQSGPNPPRAWGWIFAYFSLAGVAIIAAIAVWRRPPMGESRWLLFGILIGLGIAGLLEGTCWFAN